MGSTTRRHRRRVTTDQTVLAARLHAGDRDAFDRLYPLNGRPGLRRGSAGGGGQ